MATEQEIDLSFDDAFAQAVAEEVPATKPVEKSVETPPAETPPVETPPAETPPAETPPADTPPEESDADKIARLQAELEAARKPAAAPAPAPAAKPAPAAEPESPAPAPAYTAEEQKIIDTYKQDWPDISTAESLIRRKEYQDIVAHVFTEVQSFYAPMLEYFQTHSTDEHYNAIVNAHSDYDEIVDGVQGWIDQQPAGLKAAYNEIATNGTTQDVISLVSLYKQANNIATKPKADDSQTGLPKPAAPAAVVVKPAATPQITQAAKQAATKLGVVGTERAAPPQAGAVTFDDAFAQAVAEG